MGKISRELRHQHEAEVYDAMGEDMLSSLTDDDLVCPVGQIPFHNHEQVDLLTCALDLIRPLEGMKILEIGTGHGLMSTYLAQCGAQVTGLDVSSTILEVARRRAEVNGVSDKISLHTVPAEEFDAPDASFDAVFGNNVLHHLDLEGSAPNIARLLRPGGRASFCEPVLFTPPFVRAMREAKIVQKRFPLHTHTPDEKSLDMDDIRVLAAPFGSAHWRPVHLVCRLQNFVDLSESTFGKIEKFDQFVLDRVQPAARLCRSIVLSLSPNPEEPAPDARFRRLDRATL